MANEILKRPLGYFNFLLLIPPTNCGERDDMQPLSINLKSTRFSNKSTKDYD